MSDKPNNAGGVTDETSGQIQEPDKSKDTVAYSTYTKVLSEKKKRDEELEETRKRLSELEKAEKARHEAELKAKEDYKTLLALKDEELKKRDAKLGEIESTLERGAKLRAILDKVNGQVDEQYWRLIDVNEVKLDPSTGIPDELSVESVARKFEKEFQLVVKSKDAPKTLPNDAAKGPAGKMTYAEWKNLKSASEMREKQHLVDWSTANAG